MRILRDSMQRMRSKGICVRWIHLHSYQKMGVPDEISQESEFYLQLEWKKTISLGKVQAMNILILALLDIRSRLRKKLSKAVSPKILYHKCHVYCCTRLGSDHEQLGPNKFSIIFPLYFEITSVQEKRAVDNTSSVEIAIVLSGIFAEKIISQTLENQQFQ